jgi:predicted RNA-binding Zn-ribbon protein involved in translation (DUF1610 family)
MRTASSYEEFTLDTPSTATPELEPPVVSKGVPSHRRTPSPAKSEQHVEAVCPRCGSHRLRRSRRAGVIERFREVSGAYPYRWHECLSRSFLKTSSDLLERARSGHRKRLEQRKRARERTRREVLLWGGGVFGFLAILYYLIRDTDPKPDVP